MVRFVINKAEAKDAITVRSTLRRSFGGIGLLLLVTGMTGLLAVVTVDRSMEQLIRRDAPAVAANASVLQALTQAESGERGFLLTGDEEFLTLYNLGREAVGGHFADAVRLAGDDGALARSVEVERKLASEWLEGFAERVIELRRNDPAAAVALAASGEGRRRFERFRQANAVSAELFSKRQSNHLESEQRQVTLSITGIALLVALGLLVGALVAKKTTSSVEDLQEAALAAEHEAIKHLRELDHTRQGLVASVSHELRTPLTSITGYLELLTDEDAGPLSDEQRRLIEVVERNAGRLLVTVSDILALSSAEAGSDQVEFVPTDLAGIAASVSETMMPAAAAKGVRFECARSDEATLVHGDIGQLERVVMNLVSNAIKFTPRGGRVTVAASRRGDGVELVVDDTGTGISADEQTRVFQPFFRSTTARESQVQGTGLGLAIVTTIIERHGGSIVLSSAEGIGTSVKVTLPALLMSQREDDATVGACE